MQSDPNALDIFFKARQLKFFLKEYKVSLTDEDVAHLEKIIRHVVIALKKRDNRKLFPEESKRTYLFIVFPSLIREMFREFMLIYFSKIYGKTLIQALEQKPVWMDTSLIINWKLIQGILNTQGITIETSISKNAENALKYYVKESSGIDLHRNKVAHDVFALYRDTGGDLIETHHRHILNIILFFEALRNKVAPPFQRDLEPTQ